MNSAPQTDQMFRSGSEECDYLRGRSEVHRQIAENTAEGEARMIHERLSRLYAEQAALIVLVLPD
ncbi:hypothetical protein QLH51_00880 [Sphingomonas sp. 2R-10]|uniref:hypothetical protein n=1 Tax=Sphingomonas sp. 2R-10 TaxID=3045148 RepID=UPI000F776D5D|nr:hypothetical protein [Sphingomonas sp. 2R-10]MDJ0275360.1 hypothetical protein [Sphingomonas sp. 2R-10]